ncbi:hypothetical protein K501DRAFT_330494 [Backusella circina FSU 941]|nr:hypothetical protein K501DRAFT_330494 [Backusella circina FSU 941]
MSPIKKTISKTEEQPEKTVAVESRKRGRPSKPKQEETSQTKEVKTDDKQNKEDQVKDLDIASKDEPVVKRGRGRPPSKKTDQDLKKKIVDPLAPKRGRGRPKKVVA